MKESERIEYKSDVTDSFLKTVSVYANYDGGDILFGATSDGVVTGLPDVEEAELQIAHKIRDTVKPSPQYDIRTSVEERTVSLHVFPGANKPYLYKGVAYCRHGS